MEAFLYVAAFTIGAYIFASQEPPAFRPPRISFDGERDSDSFEKPPLRKRASSADLKKDPAYPVSAPIDIPKKKKKKACDCAML